MDCVQPLFDRGPSLFGVEEARQIERAVALGGLAHACERVLAAFTSFEVRKGLLLACPFQLAVEMSSEQRQVTAALLGEAVRVDLREPKLDAEALTRPEDQLGNRVLLHADELADLGV